MPLDWTRPQNWRAGARPMVWLPIRETARALVISTSQVRRNEARPHEIGALSWKDSPNHRRHGSRDATGAIVEAWGVNLAPAAVLLPELLRLARDREDDRARWRFLRRRVAACRANILVAVDTALANRALDVPGDQAWRIPVAEAVGRIAPHTPCEALQRRPRERDHLDAALQHEFAGNPDSDRANPADSSAVSVEMHAMAPTSECHRWITRQTYPVTLIATVAGRRAGKGTR